MRTAIYIEDGVTQLVLTPETATDRQVLDTIGAASNGETPQHRFASYRGQFYDCQGGWTRWEPNYSGGIVFDNTEHRRDELSKKSLILRVEKIPVPKVQSIPEPIPNPEI